jgi:hypothetical protein
LEQPRRPRLRLIVLLAGGLLLAAALFKLLSKSPEQVAGHAWPIPAGIQAEVLNGTGRTGLARTGARLLREAGIDVVFFGNSDTVTGVTRILVRRPGQESAAEAVRKALEMGQVSTVIDTLRRVDVSVILGQDFQPRVPLHP